MGKSHFSIKKRNKEIARKLKQEQKRQNKLDKGSIQAEEDLEQTPEQALDEKPEQALG